MRKVMDRGRRPRPAKNQYFQKPVTYMIKCPNYLQNLKLELICPNNDFWFAFLVRKVDFRNGHFWGSTLSEKPPIAPDRVARS